MSNPSNSQSISDLKSMIELHDMLKEAKNKFSSVTWSVTELTEFLRSLNEEQLIKTLQLAAFLTMIYKQQMESSKAESSET